MKNNIGVLFLNKKRGFFSSIFVGTDSAVFGSDENTGKESPFFQYFRRNQTQQNQYLKNLKRQIWKVKTQAQQR